MTDDEIRKKWGYDDSYIIDKKIPPCEICGTYGGYWAKSSIHCTNRECKNSSNFVPDEEWLARVMAVKNPGDKKQVRRMPTMRQIKAMVYASKNFTLTIEEAIEVWISGFDAAHEDDYYNDFNN